MCFYNCKTGQEVGGCSIILEQQHKKLCPPDGWTSATPTIKKDEGLGLKSAKNLKSIMFAFLLAMISKTSKSCITKYKYLCFYSIMVLTSWLHRSVYWFPFDSSKLLLEMKTTVSTGLWRHKSNKFAVASPVVGEEASETVKSDKWEGVLHLSFLVCCGHFIQSQG